MQQEVYYVDFTGVKDSFDMHRIFKESMDFPDYYGYNLDALWDCLTDIWWHNVVIHIQHFECLEKVDAKTEKKVYEILVDLKHCYKECETTTHIFIDRNGVTQEIK